MRPHTFTMTTTTTHTEVRDMHATHDIDIDDVTIDADGRVDNDPVPWGPTPGDMGMIRRDTSHVIDLDDIDIDDAYACVVAVEEYGDGESGPRAHVYMRDVDGDGVVFDWDEPEHVLTCHTCNTEERVVNTYTVNARYDATAAHLLACGHVVI